MARWHLLWRAVQPPLFLFCVALTLHITWNLLDLPHPTESTEFLTKYFLTYGYATALIGAFLEGLFMVGWYFPGSLIIFLAVILAPTPLQAVISIAFVTLGLFVSYVVNFFLGKYGWYRLLLFIGLENYLKESQERLRTYGARAILVTYFNPGLAAFTSTAAGTLQFPLAIFLTTSAVALIFWNSAWGILVSIFREELFAVIYNWYLVIGGLLLWTLLRYVSIYRRERKDILP
jgi:membrane protein DedA with SNARE-associated domain